MADKQLLVTVGLPRAGKTTWAKSTGLPVVNPDSIRLALHGKPFIGTAEPFVWATAQLMVRSLFEYGFDHVILDSTCTTRSRRKTWISSSWDTVFRVFDTEKAECLRRARQITDQDHRNALISAIHRMADQYERPMGSEGAIIYHSFTGGS